MESHLTGLIVRSSIEEDSASIHGLYVQVAKVPGGLARLEAEVSESYVENFIKKSIASGISLVAELEDQVVGEIHAYGVGLYCFSHVLSDLTIAIHPNSQNFGIGRLLFSSLIKQVEENMPDINRIELIARESNKTAIAFYESLGFCVEGCFQNRIKNLDGSLENDIPMAWARP